MKSNKILRAASSLLLAFLVFFSFLTYQPTFAEKSEISVYINGSKVNFDVAPVIINGRTLVPLRKIFEALSATVEWDQKTSTVTATKGDTVLSMTIGGKEYILNGQKNALDVPATLLGGRTMIPARLVSEALGCKVEWDHATSSVLITLNNHSGSDSDGSKSENTDVTKRQNPDETTEKRIVMGLDPKNTMVATIDGAKLRIGGRLEYDEFNEIWVELHHGDDFNNLVQYDKFLNQRYAESSTDDDWYYSNGYLKLDEGKRFEFEIDLLDSAVQQIRIFGVYRPESGGKDRYRDDGNDEYDYTAIDNDALYIARKDGEYRFVLAKEYRNNLEVMKTIGAPGNHLSTAHMMPAVKESLQRLSDSIVGDAKTDREKLLRIHDWMTKNLNYNSNYDNVNDEGVNYDAPLDIVDKQLSQCYGFSILFTDLARLQGIPTTKVIGYISRDTNADVFPKNDGTLHSWNISYADGRWIHIDVTWDNQNELTKSVIYKKMPSHAYFDIELSVFSKDHAFDYFMETHDWDAYHHQQ